MLGPNRDNETNGFHSAAADADESLGVEVAPSQDRLGGVFARESEQLEEQIMVQRSKIVFESGANWWDLAMVNNIGAKAV